MSHCDSVILARDGALVLLNDAYAEANANYTAYQNSMMLVNLRLDVYNDLNIQVAMCEAEH